MTDNWCSCHGGTDTTDTARDRLLTEPPVLEAELPEDLQATLVRFVGEGSVDTLGEWAREVRRRTGGDAISIEDLCHVEEPTDHWGELEGRRYHFACFYDAVILAALSERTVDVRTESPNGHTIEARATGDELTSTPPEAVFSFGISEDVEPASERSILEDGYAAICPYVRAFPNAGAYERWAENVQAPTVAMPLEGATQLAAELVR
ncbi:organomercurial lyase [Natrialbaceae archaeon A-gly3]